MTVTKIAPIGAPSDDDWTIAGITPYLSGDDAALERLEAIFGLATTLAVAHRDARQLGTKSGLANLNPATLSAAFDGIALLAVDATRVLRDSV